MILGKQYLESGVYTLTIEESLDLDPTSYVYTKYGTFKIVPVVARVQDFNSLIKYDVFLEDGFIGSTFVPADESIEDFESVVAQTMASAINIVSTKLNELIDKEEMEIMTKMAMLLFSGVAMTEEQKAMYRTFINENNQLPDVIEEMKNPTDILGENATSK